MDAGDDVTLKINDTSVGQIDEFSIASADDVTMTRELMFDQDGNLTEISRQTDCDACETLCKPKKVDEKGWYDFLMEPDRHSDDPTDNCIRHDIAPYYESMGYDTPKPTDNQIPIATGGHGSIPNGHISTVGTMNHGAAYQGSFTNSEVVDQLKEIQKHQPDHLTYNRNIGTE